MPYGIHIYRSQVVSSCGNIRSTPECYMDDGLMSAMRVLPGGILNTVLSHLAATTIDYVILLLAQVLCVVLITIIITSFAEWRSHSYWYYKKSQRDINQENWFQMAKQFTQIITSWLGWLCHRDRTRHTSFV